MTKFPFGLTADPTSNRPHHVVKGKIEIVPDPLTIEEIGAASRAAHEARMAEADKKPKISVHQAAEATAHFACLLEVYVEQYPGLLEELASATDRMVATGRMMGRTAESYGPILKTLKIELSVAKDMTDARSRNVMTLFAHYEAASQLRDLIYNTRDRRGPEPAPMPTFIEYLRTTAEEMEPRHQDPATTRQKTSKERTAA